MTEGRDQYLANANAGLVGHLPMTLSPEETESLKQRNTSEVFMDHLAMRKEGRLEDDLIRNYDPEIIIVSNWGIFKGFDGVRDSASTLLKNLPSLNYKFDSLLMNDNGAAFEEWSGSSDTVEVTDGIDAFIIRNGKIVIQTIWYTVQPKTVS